MREIIREIFFESFYRIDDKEVEFKFGKGKKYIPYSGKGSNVNNITTYSVYNAKGFINDVKMIKSGDLDKFEYERFIQTTSKYLYYKIIRPNKVSVLITPKSSSNILNDVIAELKRISQGIDFYPEAMVKVIDPSEIEIAKDDPRITQSIIDVLESILRRAKKEGYFQIKRVDKRFAKFIKGFFTLGTKFSKNVGENTHIMVLDDVLSSGVTISEIYKNLDKLGYKNISGATIFKF